MRPTFTFARILGIPIGAHSSWFIVFALVTWSLAANYFPAVQPDWSPALAWLLGLVTSLVFFASVLTHELGHAVIALREGVPVKRITLFIFGGIAQVDREPPSAGAELRIAIAGPITSLGLGALFGVVAWVATSPIIETPARYLSLINVLLGVFNLVPGFPLDGGRVLRAILWWRSGDFRRASAAASFSGKAVAFVFVLWGVQQIFSGNLLGGIWIAFIGWFLQNAAEATQQQAVLKDVLGGVRARDVMSRDPPTVPRWLPLTRLVHEKILSSGRRCFIVADEAGTSGIVTLHQVKTVARDRWPFVTVADVMLPIEEVVSASPDEEVLLLLQRMDERNIHQLPVLEDGQLIGLITREHLLRFIRTRAELGPA